MKKFLKRAVLVLLVLFIGIQFIPYGRAHENPPVTGEPDWDSPRTRELAKRACFDCHSNETNWPWYSHVAPMSWLVQRDVDEGREELNFTEWDMEQKEAEDAAEMVRKGEMPLKPYLLLHPEADLDDAERAQLIRGLEATCGED